MPKIINVDEAQVCAEYLSGESGITLLTIDFKGVNYRTKS